MSRGRALQVLSELAHDHWGMFTAAQARRFGVSRVDCARLIADEVVEPVVETRRVYRLTAVPENPDVDPIRAAWLHLGGARTWQERQQVADAVVSHRSAAHIRQLGDIIPQVHEFYVRRRQQITHERLKMRVRISLDHQQWSFKDGLPTSTIPVIIHDLLEEGEPISVVAQIAQDAVIQGLLDETQLTNAIRPLVVSKKFDNIHALVSQLMQGPP